MPILVTALTTFCGAAPCIRAGNELDSLTKGRSPMRYLASAGRSAWSPGAGSKRGALAGPPSALLEAAAGPVLARSPEQPQRQVRSFGKLPWRSLQAYINGQRT
jgi:hypothetical protein